MAHRHTVQKRAKGGRLGKSGGGDVYSGAKSKVRDEAESKEEDFRRGGVTLKKAHGGAAKKRADMFARGGKPKKFAEGGKVWAEPHGDLGGKKGFAAKVETDDRMPHDELDDSDAGGTETSAYPRSGHGEKAKHQYAKGGKVKFGKGGKAEKPFAKGGKVVAKKHGGECDDEED